LRRRDAFVTRLTPAGEVSFSTYLGGSFLSDDGYGIAVDTSGIGYVTGYTSSDRFPTVKALQTFRAGGADVFVAKIDSNTLSKSESA